MFLETTEKESLIEMIPLKGSSLKKNIPFRSRKKTYESHALAISMISWIWGFETVEMYCSEPFTVIEPWKIMLERTSS